MDKIDIGIRRLVLVILSIVGGIALTFGLLEWVRASNQLFELTLEQYGYVYAILTALPLAIFVGIWLDLFMGTKLLADGPAEGSAAKPAHGVKAEE